VLVGGCNFLKKREKEKKSGFGKEERKGRGGGGELLIPNSLYHGFEFAMPISRNRALGWWMVGIWWSFVSAMARAFCLI
jgi:hypothetical protein